ncbi:hypothetical protein MYCTH_2310866 [Thermothelomyces thermophilus ATCC 42464]|uniref:Uncharacterized protein n=1 Tax=Thermothelomyces thermophilus (strain ATCC 42464 / BCRC 31852 / DSM 1799) TaxID=573729 RepID=G2QM78_THET4|nr:uncharacterized protein MYCTH_2310866 [Thermothelomyces thermophilus ATCC 42464]AEO61058.1 hypothetical protein MYCTH_2310866 [Thermothelomyces thermophilus ATCC 42464]
MPQLPPTARAAARSAAAAAAAAATRATVARGPSRAAFSSSSPRLPADIVEQKLKVKRIIYTIGFAAVIITGTIYGAGLKTQQEWKASKQKLQEATVDEKVAMLEAQKVDLLRQKEEIEGKLAELRARMRSGAGDGEGRQARG